MKLTNTAHIGGKAEVAVVFADTVAGKRTVEIRLERQQPIGQVAFVDFAEPPLPSGLARVSNVGHQQALRGVDTGRRRHQHLGHAEIARHEGRVDRPGAAEAKQREVADVETSLDGEFADRLDHAGIGDTHDAERRLLQ